MKMPEFLLMTAIVAAVVVYTVHRITMPEPLQMVTGELMESRWEKDFDQRLDEVIRTVSRLADENDATQEHLSLLRKQQQDLASRQPTQIELTVKHIGPIPMEIHPGTKRIKPTPAASHGEPIIKGETPPPLPKTKAKPTFHTTGHSEELLSQVKTQLEEVSR